MTGPPGRAQILPPRPRRRDWCAAGACAGTLLGLAEILWAGLVSPPRLALALVAADAIPVALGAGALGAGLRALGWRLSYSAMVGAVLAPLAWCFLLAGTLGAGATRASHWLALAAGLSLAAGASALVAAVANRAERAGFPVSGVFVWAGAAALLAIAARSFHAGAAPVPRLALGVGLALAAPGLAALAGLEWVRSRGAGSVRPLGTALGGLCAIAVGVAWVPLAWPWLVQGSGMRELPDPATMPASFVFATLPLPDVDAAERPPGIEAAPTLSLLAAEGVLFRRVRPGTAAGPPALQLPDGRALLHRLQERGYVTAAVVADPSADPLPRVEQIDARPGPLGLLRGALWWTTGARALLGPARAALAPLGLDAAWRGPSELVADATRWMLRWRASPEVVPFFLSVDLRSPGSGLDEADAAFGALLEMIEQLVLDDRVCVIAGFGGASNGQPLPLVLRPPAAWAEPRWRGRAVSELPASEIGATLWRIASLRGVAPVPLPGL